MDTTASSTKVLYVEDDAGLARLIQKKLERENYNVEIANNGDMGLQRLQEKIYDIIIVDYNLPVYNGLEIIRKSRELEIETPIIMLTGAGNEAIAVEAMKLGASDYIVKDVETGYLTLVTSVIERTLEQDRLRKAKIQWEKEREELIVELKKALAEVKHLSGLLPICAACKRIRDDSGYWNQLEVYLRDHSEAEFSHAICPECAQRLYPTYVEEEENGKTK